MAPTSSSAVSKAQTESPYRLDGPQVLKASGALVKHINSESKRKEVESTKKNLLAEADSDSEGSAQDAEAIWLVLTTKKHIVDQKRLKPGKIALPHTLNKAATSICIITPDPQRQFKDVVDHPSFPTSLKSQIRILGISKLKARTKTFQEKRRLLDDFDVFMADDRVVTMLPKVLGKIFFEGTKRPIPISLEGYRPKENGKRVKTPKDSETKSIASPEAFAKEIEKTMSSARVHLSPSVTTSVLVGYSNFSSQQITDNVQAVVNGMTEKFVTKGWRNVKTIHIKGPNTVAFPLWMADELWVEEEDVLEDAVAEEMKKLDNQKGTKRKGQELEEGEESGKKRRTKLLTDEGFNKEMAERREKLRQAKREARDEAENVAVEATTAKADKAKGSKKVKVKKTKAIEASA